jgi:integrase/recombinase XerD
MPREYDPARTCMKVELWPAAERKAWEAALKKGRLFDKPGRGAHWKPLTVVANAKSYGRWLSWLAREQLLDPGAGPCQQITPENVGRYMDHLATQVSTGMIAHRIADLYTVAKAMDPACDWSWIREAWYRTSHDAKPVKNKLARLVNARDLHRFGLELMKKAESDQSGSEFQRTLMYRDGLIIALLAARSLRLENFASIEIGKHLARRGEEYWLLHEETETKNEIEIDWPIPQKLIPQLERYLSFYRPKLIERHARFSRGCPPAGDHLWVSRFGGPLTAHGMYGQIIARTQMKFGRSVNPHLFRDAVATTVAIEDPAHVGIIKSLLGHHDARTSERHYNQARATEAVFEHQRRLMALRRKAA